MIGIDRIVAAVGEVVAPDNPAACLEAHRVAAVDEAVVESVHAGSVSREGVAGILNGEPLDGGPRGRGLDVDRRTAAAENGLGDIGRIAGVDEVGRESDGLSL